jgi:hypothetical protein
MTMSRKDLSSFVPILAIFLVLASGLPEAQAADVCSTCCMVGTTGACRITCGGAESYDLSLETITFCLDSISLMINSYPYLTCNYMNTECLADVTTTTTTTTSSTTTSSTSTTSTAATTTTTTLIDTGYVSGGYRNIYSVLQLDPLNDNLSDPVHNISEYAFFNRSRISPGTGSTLLGSGSVIYMINTGFLPMARLEDSVSGRYVDYGYRGKIIIFGREYYVRDISGASKIYACNGTVKVTDNLGFFGDYKGYKFKVDHLLYDSAAVSGVILDVQKPDGTIVQRQLTGAANGLVDGLEIWALNVSFSGSRTAVQLLVYDLGSEIILQDGVAISIDGAVNDEWVASFITQEQPLSESVGIPSYRLIDSGQKLLSNISLRFIGSQDIRTGENLSMPSGYKVIYDGLDVELVDYTVCNLAGDTTPCNIISLQEIIDRINKWSAGDATLSSVINLINGWFDQ